MCRLVSGSSYPVTAATSTRLTVGAQALLGIAGVDGIVDRSRGGQLGLARNIAVLVNAPATSPLTLIPRRRTPDDGSTASSSCRPVPTTRRTGC